MAHKKEEYKEELYGDAVREKLLEFAEDGYESIPEDEREAWFSRFKFCGVFHQRDGQEGYFMMRLTNCNGRLEPGQLRAIGEVAQEYAHGPIDNPEYGSGWIDFTTRTGTPEGGAQDSINDIGLEPATKEVDGEEQLGFNVRVGGGLGGHEPRVARPLDVFVTPDNAYEVVRGFVELYHEHGNREVRSKNRSRFFVDEHGTDWIRELLQAEYVDFALHTAGEDMREEYTYNAGRSDAERFDYLGVHEQGDGNYYVGLSVAVGRMAAEEAIELADLADEYGSGRLRLTRRQNPILIDIDSDRVDELLDEPLLDVHKPEPNPFTRGAMACTGTEFCNLALTETKTRMATMLRWLRDNVALPEDVDQLKMHFSGCTADCGHANTADIGLIGMRGRKNGEMVEALDLGVGGGIGEEPAFVNWIRQRIPADEVPGAIKNLIEAFAAHREAGQTFREWVDATGEEALVELSEPTESTYEDPCLTDAKQAWYPFADSEASSPEAASADD